MSKSITRVTDAAVALGLDIKVQRMPQTTHSAVDAALACDCELGQIVKSLIFEGRESGALMLVLLAGHHELDMERAAETFGEPLTRADPKRVRSETGFAIGGVAPIGHLTQPKTWLDRDLLQYQVVWAAAGAPDAVFSIDPKHLSDLPGVQVFSNTDA